MLSAIKLQFFPNPTKNYPRKTSLPKISSQIPSPSRPSHEFIKLPRGANSPSEMAYCGFLHASERRSLKRSLEIAAAGAVSLGGAVVASHHKWGHGTLDTHDAPFFCVRRSFFRRSRLFFREAAFSSGSEGCEWRAQRATVGESGDKAENEFTALSPLVVLRRASALTSPPPDFLLSSIPPKPPNLTKSSSRYQK